MQVIVYFHISYSKYYFYMDCICMVIVYTSQAPNSATF